eukprot:CAMPEP_0201730186 /NCGR_PEP_ID=MMETSP0593-20130828/21362_1 /ASSEMBLY_ACC=CAM_ASM_000672 /TAXON_ID=267983 /ORGANISM="Skeletonema japonicum, Strain CCMP2506" /LENGTH=203 /DNA_ID=CAMNT_0048222673 /DNA_START=21 /DNA_END=632 /DNA_ORIENTATION=+
MKLRPRKASLPEPEENLAVLDVLAQAAEEEVESNAAPSPATKKRKRIYVGPRKQYRKICTADGCNNIAQKEGVCNKHHKTVQRKICTVEECTSIAQRGGVCFRHGAKYKKKSCSREGCSKRAIQGGVCIRHGAKRPAVVLCAVERCTKQRVKGGVCRKHYSQMTAAKEEEGDNEGEFEAITNAISKATKTSKKNARRAENGRM